MHRTPLMRVQPVHRTIPSQERLAIRAPSSGNDRISEQTLLDRLRLVPRGSIQDRQIKSAKELR